MVLKQHQRSLCNHLLLSAEIEGGLGFLDGTVYTMVYRKFEEGTRLHSLKMDATYITGKKKTWIQLQNIVKMLVPINLIKPFRRVVYTPFESHKVHVVQPSAMSQRRIAQMKTKNVSPKLIFSWLSYYTQCTTSCTTWFFLEMLWLNARTHQKCSSVGVNGASCLKKE